MGKSTKRVVNFMIVAFCAPFIIYGLLTDNDEEKMIFLIGGGAFLLFFLIIKAIAKGIKNEANRMEKRLVSKDVYSKRKTLLQQEEKNKEIAKKIGFDKYDAIKSEIPKLDIDEIVKLGAAFESSVYQEKEKDWALLGGIASGIGGVGAGIATATRVMQENEKIRERNAEARRWAAKQSKEITDLAMKGAATARERISDFEGYLYGCKAVATESIDELFSHLSIRKTFGEVDEATGAFNVKVEWSNKSDKHIDGSLVALFYSSGGKCVGCAYLPLPLDGTMGGSGVLTGVCAYPMAKEWHKITIKPYSLWEFVRKDKSGEKAMTQANQNSKILKEIEHYEKKESQHKKEVDEKYKKETMSENERDERIFKRAMRIIMAVVITIVSLAILIPVGVLVYDNILSPKWSYDQAVELMNEGEYAEACSLFERLADDGYKDSATLLCESYYRDGKRKLSQGNYDEARSSFWYADEYKDSENYETYAYALSSDNLFEHEDDFRSLPADFEDVEGYLKFIENNRYWADKEFEREDGYGDDPVEFVAKADGIRVIIGDVWSRNLYGFDDIVTLENIEPEMRYEEAVEVEFIDGQMIRHYEDEDIVYNLE